MKKTALSLFTLLLAAVFALPVAAHADTLNLVLTNPTQTGTGGTTLTFEATVSAPLSNTGSVSLISDTISIGKGNPFQFSDFDDSYFNNFPFTLDPGQSFIGTLFTLTLPAAIAPGFYDNNFIGLFVLDAAGAEILPDPSAKFAIDVPGTSPVPEPGTWVLMVTGSVALFAVVYSRRRPVVFGRAA